MPEYKRLCVELLAALEAEDQRIIRRALEHLQELEGQGDG